MDIDYEISTHKIKYESLYNKYKELKTKKKEKLKSFEQMGILNNEKRVLEEIQKLKGSLQ